MAQHSQETKDEALRLYPELGTSATAERLGVPPRTVRYWANQAGLATARSQALEKAGEELAAMHANMRQELHIRLLEGQLDALDRMDQTHVEYKAAGSDMHKLEHDTATSGDMRNYASIVKDLNAVYRLEMGEATSRTRIDAESVVDGELRRTMEEWQRQHIQTSPDSP